MFTTVFNQANLSIKQIIYCQYKKIKIAENWRNSLIVLHININSNLETGPELGFL